MSDLYDPGYGNAWDASGSLVATSNPDAWLDRATTQQIDQISADYYSGGGWQTTYEDIGSMNTTSGFFDTLSGIFTGIGNAGNSLFDALGDIKGAQQEYKQGNQAALLAAQQAQFMKYALIGGGILVLVLLLKD